MRVCILVRKHIPWHDTGLINLEINKDHGQAHREFREKTGIDFRTLRDLITRKSLTHNSGVAAKTKCLFTIFSTTCLSPKPISDSDIGEIIDAEYDVIIPIDDDDFICPEIIEVIKNIPMARLKSVNYLTWNSLEYNYVTGYSYIGRFIKPEDSPFGGIEDLILPTSYAIIVTNKDKTQNNIQEIKDKINIFTVTDKIKRSMAYGHTLDFYGIGALKTCHLASEYYLTSNDAVSHLNERPKIQCANECIKKITDDVFNTIQDGEKLSKICHPNNP